MVVKAIHSDGALGTVGLRAFLHGRTMQRPALMGGDLCGHRNAPSRKGYHNSGMAPMHIKKG